jgi:hypothetical protein
MLNLSFEEDRSFALAGIAQRVQEATGYTYFAGMWREDLVRALCWTGTGPFYPKSADAPNPTAPSWSWMSRRYRTNHHRIDYSSVKKDNFLQDPRLQIHDHGTFCKTLNGNPFSEIVSAQIEITAAFITGKVESTIKGHYRVQCTLNNCSFAPRFASNYSFEDTDAYLLGEDVLCLLLGISSGDHLFHILVVQADAQVKGSHRRIGYADGRQYGDSKHINPFDNAEVRLFLLI